MAYDRDRRALRTFAVPRITKPKPLRPPRSYDGEETVPEDMITTSQVGKKKRGKVPIDRSEKLHGLVVFLVSSVFTTVPSAFCVTVVSFDLTVPSLLTLVFLDSEIV